MDDLDRSGAEGLPTDRRDGDPSTAAPEPDEEATADEWRRRYEAARQALLAGEFAAAAVQLAELEKTAPSATDRAAAHALRTLADEWTARGLAFTRRPELVTSPAAPAPDKRSVDEIVGLYTSAAVYGIGSGIWLGTLTQPDKPAPVIIPSLALTAGSVGTVIALDTGPGFRYGVPQSITSGMWIGFEHGLVWAIVADLQAEPGGFETATATTIMWSLSTLGAVGGGVLGSILPTTPGRSGWVGSTALWTGTLGGLTVGALDRNGDPPTAAFVVAGAGLTIGTGVGMLTAGSVSPSIARVRLMDLSAILGGLTGTGLYVAGAGDETEGRGIVGSMALGVAAGLAVGWVATSKMSADPLRRSDSQTSTPQEESAGSRGGFLARVRPLIVPSPGGGAMMAAGGTLD